MDYVAEFDLTIAQVTKILGKPISKDKYTVVDRGVPHKPKSLLSGTMGIYTFLYNGKFLKIGKVGSKSNARFLSQHYIPDSTESTLASSLLSDPNMQKNQITKDNISDWIKENCRRIDILIDADLGIFTLGLVEAILHYKYEPTYEGFISQR